MTLVTFVLGKKKFNAEIHQDSEYSDLHEKAKTSFNIEFPKVDLFFEPKQERVSEDNIRDVLKCNRNKSLVISVSIPEDAIAPENLHINELITLKYPGIMESVGDEGVFRTGSLGSVIYNVGENTRKDKGKYHDSVQPKSNDEDDNLLTSEKLKKRVTGWKHHEKPISNRDPGASCYNTINGVKGPFIIFNYKHFAKKLNRNFANEVALNIAEVAITLGYSPVRIFNDLSKTRTKEWLEKFSKAKYEGLNTIGCAISSHGNKSNKIATFDYPMDVKKFYSAIGGTNCEDTAILGEPKLFFLQACRGDGKDFGKDLDVNRESDPAVITIPTESNFIFFNSTTHGMSSFRRPFFKIIKEVFLEHSDKEIMQMMQRVNEEMAKFAQEVPSVNRVAVTNTSKQGKEPASRRKYMKQMPSTTYQLTKALYFGPKIEDIKAFPEENVQTTQKLNQLN